MSSRMIVPTTARSNTRRMAFSLSGANCGDAVTKSASGITYVCSTSSYVFANWLCSRSARRSTCVSSGRRGAPYRVSGNRAVTLFASTSSTVKSIVVVSFASFFVSGGFLEVRPDEVTVLADAAERADDIDEARAEESRRRAQSLLEQKGEQADLAAASAALARAEARLRLAELRRRRRT